MGLPARDDRPGLGERYGIAVNASTLELGDGRESALDVVAEMGYARIGMSAAALNEQERKEAELAPWLWGAGYGDDRTTALAKACTLFADLLRMKPYFAEIERVDPGIAQRFSECLINEWLSACCPKCGGSGWEEITGTGKRVRPSGRSRNAPKAICLRCRGSGRPPESQHMRVRVLQAKHRKIAEVEYRMLWRRQFSLARRRLKEISAMPRNHLIAARTSV